jgi:hypothetical protein
MAEHLASKPETRDHQKQQQQQQNQEVVLNIEFLNQLKSL